MHTKMISSLSFCFVTKNIKIKAVFRENWKVLTKIGLDYTLSMFK